MPIKVDSSRDKLIQGISYKRLKESYMRDEEQSPQERFAYVCEKFGSNAEHAQRMYDYASKHWVSFSTPILSFGRSKKGLPISCFESYMEDTAEGLVNTLSEVNTLSMLGGGVGIHLEIRSADEKSVGVMPHLKIYDAACLAYRQGRTRRGSYAAFLSIDHPDIIQFLEMRKPTGDPNIRTLNLHHGVCIPDSFMHLIEQSMKDEYFDDSWDLKDPNNGRVVETVSARELWQRLLELRMQTGEPYIVFIDTANKTLPSWLKDKGLSIKGSNLCTEIFLPTGPDRTAVCCLSSLNIEYFDQWKDDELFICDVMEFLDNVLQYFIDNAPDSIKRAKYSALRERSIGIGALGFCAYLQSKLIPLESALAKSVNFKVFKHINDELAKADRVLCQKRGPCPDAADSGVQRRFSHWSAIAPNASSSLIMRATSPSIEPLRANIYRQDTLSGAHTIKNRMIEPVLEQYGLNNEEVWTDIIAHDGSIAHLTQIPEHIRDVFKTAQEIDQRWLIELAADRQPFIDQGQSVNLFFPADVSIAYLHACHFMAWKLGLKSLYYCRSDKLRKADRLGEKVERNRLEDQINMASLLDENACLACEG